MKITEVRVFVTCPAGEAGQTYVLVKILTDQGVYGVGEGTKNGRELAVASLLENHLAPTLIGKDPGAIEDIWKYLYRGAYWRGGPIQNTALAAIDMALWDIKGKVAGLPVYSLLGGPTRRGLLTYVHAHGRDLDEATDEVLKYKERGYKVIRAQVETPGMPGGYGAEDKNDPAYREAFEKRLPYEGVWEPEPYLQIVPRLFEHLRDKVGWDVELFHDAHGRLSPIQAARLAKSVEPYRLMFLEDPISPENVEGMRIVRQASTTPLGIGEIISSKFQIMPMLLEQTIDYMRCSPMHIGGITEGKKLAAMAEPFDIRTAFHGPGDVGPIGAAASAHVGMAIPNFGIQEWVRHADIVHEVMTGGAWFEDGYLKLPDTPGLGVDINEELVARFAWHRKYLPAIRRADGSMHGY
ncbi:MAG: D-galactonate dehydratase family protein [Anaerolineae bacterium]